jgi:hypothetical protein
MCASNVAARIAGGGFVIILGITTVRSSFGVAGTEGENFDNALFQSAGSMAHFKFKIFYAERLDRKRIFAIISTVLRNSEAAWNMRL